MIIRHVSELRKIMTDEQKKEADAMYDKYYGIPFGHLEPVMCTTSADDDGEDYLQYVDVDNWN